MSERVVSSMEAGRPVAVKRSRGGRDLARLRREAEVLRTISHPGVVELIRLDEANEPVELVTAFVGPHSLLTIGRLPPEVVAGIVIAVARTVSDLHGRGIVHGRIDASHVLLATHGGPVLCSLGEAGRTGQAVGDRRLEPTDDVAALGELLIVLLGDELEPDPMPESRVAAVVSSVRRHAGPEAWRRRALLQLADHAAADDPAIRPTASELADAIAAAVPTACLPAPAGQRRSVRVGDGDAAGSRPSRRRHRAMLVAAVALGAPALVLATSLRRPEVTAGRAAATTPAPTTRPAGGPAATAAATPVEPTPAGPAPVATAGTTLDGRTLLRDGRRWSAGAPGDRVTVGDWDCDGTPTPGVVRPSTGEVFLFDGWSTVGAPLVATPATTVPGATGIRADGCGAAVVERGAAPPVEVQP